ncbi:MAG TPA: hypothetical protein VN258_15380 [Mobilitalea sp.]|nr:hypothetical protein [Mobilitalea sp.]
MDLSANKYGDDTEYGFGLVDLEFALEQYDELKAIYNNAMNTTTINEATENGILQDNQGDVITFDDVTYVEGSWATDEHKIFTELTDYINGTKMTTNGITIVKLGAVANDTYLGAFTTYPQFHGFMSKQEGTPTYQSNYMASYIYITNIAVGIKNSTTPIVPSYLTSNDRTGIDTYLTTSGFCGNSWTTLLQGYTTGSTNKSLFVYGIALHTVTDMLAHSTYNATDGSYISHALGADTIFKSDGITYNNRYVCAQLIARKVISHIKAFEPGDISDFYNISDVYDGSFYIGRYSQYAQAVDYNYYNSNSWFFNWVNKN